MNESKQHTVERDGERDLTFTGILLAEASSYRCNGPSSNRWTEIAVYQTNAGKYIVSILGRTCWQGEHDRHEAHICEAPGEVVDAMRQDGYLSRLAKEVLDELATLDAFKGVCVESVD